VTEPRCIPIEELARVRELPADAPERVHAAECPRCRAALLALAEFERQDVTLPAEAGAERARARLDAAIESLTSPAPAAAAPGRGRAAREPGWLARLLAPPALRWASAFAVLAVVAASAWFAVRGPAAHAPRGGRVVRGEAAEASPLSVRATGAGWELAWSPVAGADSYDLVFLDSDLREVARLTGLREARIVLSRESLPPGVAPGVPMLVEVDARAGGDVVRSAVPAAFRLD
jgi:hypothetical protein